MNRRDLLILGAGTAIAGPLIARAQQKAMPVIGFLSVASPGTFAVLLTAFHQGLSEAGYIEGQNVAIEYRWAEGRYDRLPGLAAELVGRQVDVILVSAGSLGALAAKGATSTIPIVFTNVGDPVGVGLVASVSRPGGNATGMNFFSSELMPKRLELLSDLVPQVSVIAMLVNPDNPAAQPTIGEVQAAARTKGAQIEISNGRTETEIDNAFAVLAQHGAGALIVLPDAFFDRRRDQIVRLAARHAIPAIYQWREYVAAGGLISYGPDPTAAFHQAGAYVGRILSGAKPGDLPVQQPTTFELVINLKTAKALGLTIPQSILARADEVIE